MHRHIVHSLPLYEFDTLSGHPGLRHAISTRLGGVSPAPFASLNLTTARGDDRAHVAENLHRLCAAVDTEVANVISPQQIHGARVERVGRDQRGRIIAGCDGLVTDEPDVALLLRFADCVSLIVYDPRRHALGLGHAGWRGTLAGIATALVDAMTREFDSRPAEIIAGIGPAIGPCCYQVGPEVVEATVAAFEQPDGLLPAQSDGYRHLDLWAANRRLLEEAGVRQIETAGLCTACHVTEFFSHRAEHGRTGHHGALAYLKE
jgi:YfiH family protein